MGTAPPIKEPEEKELNKAQVVNGTPLNSGDATYQAEILVQPPGGGTNHVGRMRTMCVRGPSRPSYDQAKEDADALNKAAVDGDAKAVRALANELQKTKNKDRA